MFEAPRSRFPWAMPLLEPEFVADGLVDAILKNRREVVLPHRVGILNKLCRYQVYLVSVLMTLRSDHVHPIRSHVNRMNFSAIT